MEISGISPQVATVVLDAPLVEGEGDEDDTVEDPIITGDGDEVGEQGDDGDGGKGMIEKLLGGHFKGVADARLRIVHQDKLAAIEKEQIDAAVSDGVAGITKAIGEGIEEFLGSDEGAEGVSEEQAVAVRESYEVFSAAMSAAGELGAEEAVVGVESAFSQLVEAIRSLFAVSDEEDGEEEDAVVPESVEDLISGLEESLADGLEQMEAGIEAVDVFGEVSAASGKGGAYDKFMAIYNELGDFEGGEDSGGELPVA